MAVVEEIVDLSDDDDDDCILEYVTYSIKQKNYNAVNYDNVFKESPLLAEIIEKCFNIESSEGMHRVINHTLLRFYKEADTDFKTSAKFETTLKRTLISLDKDPQYRFSYIKHLCETLQFNKFKKRGQLITLENNIKGKKGISKLALKRKYDKKNRSKRLKTDIIDLDKLEDIPIINLDYDPNDLIIIDDSLIVNEDAKENHALEDNEECVLLQGDDNLIVQVKDKHEHIGNFVRSSENNVTVPINYVNKNKPAEENSVCFGESSEDIKDRRENGKENFECSATTTPDKLLVPQKTLEFKECTVSPRVECIEQEIACYKRLIARLDEEEVTDDTYSPYLKSEKLKAKIVILYKELCQLTGTDATKRREIRLKVVKNHPSGPVRRLESFLNRNIGSDGQPPFPDFNDVLECVTKANQEDNLGWEEPQIKQEARALFTHCGLALQKRRQKREWSDLLALVKAEEFDSDPADHDPELQARLNANKRAAMKKESKILERYSKMQRKPSSITSTNVYAHTSEARDAADSSHENSLDENDSEQEFGSELKLHQEKISNQSLLDRIERVDVVAQENKSDDDFENSSVGRERNGLVQSADVVMREIEDITTSETSTVDQVDLINVKANIVFDELTHNDGSVNLHEVAESRENDHSADDVDVQTSDPVETLCSDIVNCSDTECKIEYDEVNVKVEPTEDVAKRLYDFGDNYTVSVFDIEDPFLVVDISDSSDED